ncbi:CBS domain-containing protein [Streptomyces sp. NPDC059008]|uniref:CBS domain-containing protein n=1 Tax=Streptomyces sp. NPDC059008 TaxID=3346693 RepID=UPI0036A1AB38
MARTPHSVSDVMTQTVVAIGEDARFKEIVETMEQWQVSALPVLAGEGRVIGVVSEADLLPKEEFRDEDPGLLQQSQRLEALRKAGALTAGELMSAPALTVHAGDSLAQAARTMAHRSVKRLPVVDVHGMLQGIVSRSDLLKVFLRSDEDLAAEVRTEIVDRLFAENPKEVQVATTDGVVTLHGRIRDRALLPVVARLVRAVEGVVDVTFDLRADGEPGVDEAEGAEGRASGTQ